MRVRYTVDILRNKPADKQSAGAFLAKAQWRETDANLDK